MGKKSKKNKNKNAAAAAAQTKSEAPSKEAEEKDFKGENVSEEKADAKTGSPASAKGEVTPPSTPTRNAKSSTPKATTPKASTSAPSTPQKSPMPAADSKAASSSPSPAAKSTPATAAKSTTPSTTSSKATPSSPLPAPPSSAAKSPPPSTMPPAPPSPASTPVDKQVIEEVVRRRPSLRDAHEAAISNVLLPSMHAVEHTLKPHEAPASTVSAKLQPTMHALETNLRTGHVKEVLKEHLKEHAEHAEAPTTAPLIANTAAAVKTKIAAHELQKKMERRPSVDALKESGILPHAQQVPSPHPLSTPRHTIGTSNNITPEQQPSSEHLLQRQHSRLTESPDPPYRPYATLSRRQVIGIGLKVIAEKRSLIDDMVSGFVKEKLFVDDTAMIQAIEKFVETQDLDPLASLIYHIQEAVAERNM